jgi:5-(carboxyamino)imidazole ribonucleotide synthase
VTVFAPEDDTPAGQLADREVRSAYEDLAAVADFARSVEVVTFEFENIPAATAEAAARHAPVRPSCNALHLTQDRLREKRMLTGLGLPVARFEAIEGEEDLARVSAGGWPTDRAGILKTASWGYDGKGQVRIAGAADVANAWRSFGGEGTGPRAVLEEVVPFEAELSVIGVRGVDGATALYEPTLNAHVNHILDVSTGPAPIEKKTAERAQQIARAVLDGLDYVGVLCVELFLLASGELIVNEIAPRPHNSGHGTIDSHSCSQFEQQVRAVCGLPVGSSERCVPAAAMANLLGGLWDGGEPCWESALASPAVRLHLYGKAEPRPGRKMGHLTATAATPAEAERLVRSARSALSARE